MVKVMETKEQILKQIHFMLQDYAPKIKKYKPESIKDLKLIDDLALDSLDILDLCLQVDQRYFIDIDDSFDKFVRVEDVVDYIEANQASLV